MLRSAARTVVRSALVSIRADECLRSRAVSATLRVCCSTDFAVCLTAAPAVLGELLLAILDNARQSEELLSSMSIGGPECLIGRTSAARDTTGNLPMQPGIYPDYSAPIRSKAKRLIFWNRRSPARTSAGA